MSKDKNSALKGMVVKFSNCRSKILIFEQYAKIYWCKSKVRYSFPLVGEEYLGVSGVLATVVLGVTMNSEKTMISPEVEHFLHRYRPTLHTATIFTWQFSSAIMQTFPQMCKSFCKL